MKSLPKTITGLILAALISAQTAGGAEQISDYGQKKIDDFMTLRMNLSLYDDSDTAAIIAAIDSFDTGSDSLSEEETLIMDNFLLLERYNYLKEDSSNKDMLRSALKAQKDKCDAWMAGHKKEKPNKWLCVTYADTISCYISFSLGDVIKYGLSIKDYYLQAYGQDDKCSYVLTNLAQWYFWAPKLNGGSRKKAGVYFEQAAETARTDAERYFADIFLSQYLLETGDRARAAEKLAEAKVCCPGSNYIRLLERINADGMSFFEYSRKHSKMEGKPEN